MYDGVIFQSPEFRTETPGDDKRYRFCIVVGHLTADPEVKNFRTTKTSFNIKWYTKQYLNVVIWGESDVAYAARALEKDDFVLCAGTITYTTYTIQSGEKKGEQKEWHDLNCQFLMAQAWVNCIIQMFSSQNIQNLLNSEASDPIESAGDHPDENDEAGEYVGEAEYEDFDLGI